jgi:hypothetical protein
LEKLKNFSARTMEWVKARKNRIPSSIVRRACSMTPSFLNYYSMDIPQWNIGLLIEKIIVDKLGIYLSHTGMHIPFEYQWLIATPDAYHVNLKIPVEIKCNMNGTELRKIISKNYHQLQMQMFCTKKRKILLIIYDSLLTTVLIRRNNNFINKCLVKLRQSLINEVLGIKDTCEPICSIIKDNFPIPFDNFTERKKSLIMSSKRSYNYKVVKPRFVFPHFDKVQESSLLTILASCVHTKKTRAQRWKNLHK